MQNLELFSCRAFTSRNISCLASRETQDLECQGVLVLDILLYGPLVTGKTLMARQIGKVVNTKEAKFVNGPEILNKYAGKSEEDLPTVADPEKRSIFTKTFMITDNVQYKDKGDANDLHVIIFGELDAIAKQLGTAGGLEIQYQLSNLDGVLNNIFIIG